MAITNEAIQDVVTLVMSDIERVLGTPVRTRGGITRGVSWGELSGRTSDGVWVELRIHNSSIDQRLQGDLRLYQPIIRGGQMIVAGEQAYSYLNTPIEVTAKLASDVKTWIGRLTAV